jgi:hypothetical protein
VGEFAHSIPIPIKGENGLLQGEPMAVFFAVDSQNSRFGVCYTARGFALE